MRLSNWLRAKLDWNWLSCDKWLKSNPLSSWVKSLGWLMFNMSMSYVGICNCEEWTPCPSRNQGIGRITSRKEMMLVAILVICWYVKLGYVNATTNLQSSPHARQGCMSLPSHVSYTIIFDTSSWETWLSLSRTSHPTNNHSPSSYFFMWQFVIFFCVTTFDSCFIDLKLGMPFNPSYIKKMVDNYKVVDH
jgi:hypothetical protein